MKRLLPGLFLSVSSLCSGEVDHRPPAKESPHLVLERFSFGSCCKQSKPMPIWESVVKTKPQLFLWLGDNVYADTEDMELMRQKYDQLAANSNYQKLVASCPVIATWDDHDYGDNDYGAEYPKKEESEEIFLDFFNEPANSERRKREGVYTSYLFGPEGKRVQIILLDSRYFRSALKKGPKPPYPRMGRYLPAEDPNATMLGEKQWTWLESELQKPADLRFLGLSTQFVCAHDGYEAWSNMPREKERLLELIRKTKSEGLVLLSGDSHHGELHLGEYHDIYQLWEFTSSGINQGLGATEDQTRVGPAIPVANFGVVNINWDKETVRVTVRSQNKDHLVERTINFGELTFAEKNLKPSAPITTAAKSWTTRWGQLTLQKTEEDQWSGSYGDNGKLTLRQNGNTLTGRWKRGKLYGSCQFTLSRHGHYLRGVSGDKEKPALMNWTGW